MDVTALNNRLKLSQRAMLESTKNNLDELNKFFASLWEIENHPYAPLKVPEVFAGINIPDPRKPGQELTTLYPHYLVRILDVNHPDYASHLPGSAQFMQEQEELIGIVKQVRAVAEKFNERMSAECEQQFGGQR